MAVLQALGINFTFFFQFIIASFGFFALSSLVFKPYSDALLEREKRTKGGEDEAAALLKQSMELRALYEQKAREVNGEIKAIFDSYRTDSTREYESTVSKAREEAQKVMNQSRAFVESEIAKATTRMKEEIPLLAQAISSRLLSKKA